MGVHARETKRHVLQDGRIGRNEWIEVSGRTARRAVVLAVLAMTGMTVAARVQGPIPVPSASAASTTASATASAPATSQVYKWVDADGRTHYSERKPTEPGTRAAEIKPPPPPPDNPAPRRENWVTASASPAAAPTSPATAPPESVGLRTSRVMVLSEGLDPSTDAYRCALAKDILSGAVRRSSLRPTDEHDRNIARNDIKLFCK